MTATIGADSLTVGPFEVPIYGEVFEQLILWESKCQTGVGSLKNGCLQLDQFNLETISFTLRCENEKSDSWCERHKIYCVSHLTNKDTQYYGSQTRRSPFRPVQFEKTQEKDG